jgi:hypothetical protein
MYRAWELIMIAAIVLMMVIPTSVIAQSGFTIYDNKYFRMAYPSDWTVNDTAIGDLSIEKSIQREKDTTDTTKTESA